MNELWNFFVFGGEQDLLVPTEMVEPQQLFHHKHLKITSS